MCAFLIQSAIFMSLLGNIHCVFVWLLGGLFRKTIFCSFFFIYFVVVFKRLDLMLFLTQKAELFKSKFWQMKHPNICSNLILPYINNTFKKIMKKKR